MRTVPVSSTQTAEAVKLTENIFRAVNIALVNELKLVYAKMGIDVWEVIAAAESKPFGFMPFYPGPGLGGHCIPIDPFYLSWRARQFGQPTRFIELAGEINTAMPGYVVGVVENALQERFSRSIGGARILLIGVAYKPNVEDIRETPAFTLIELLEAAGAEVDYHDPYVPEIPLTRDHAPLAGRRSEEWTPERFGDYDGVLICTGHDAIDYDALVAASRPRGRYAQRHRRGRRRPRQDRQGVSDAPPAGSSLEKVSLPVPRNFVFESNFFCRLG